jgi:hypothetical protein
MTGQDIFDAAMALMGEVTSSDYTADISAYEAQAPSILSTLSAELYPLSDTFAALDGGVRPVLEPIADLTGEIGLDDYLCLTVLPYGLAAQLQVTENPQAASFHQQRYEELKATAARSRPMEWETPDDQYGLGEYNEFGSW